MPKLPVPSALRKPEASPASGANGARANGAAGSGGRAESGGPADARQGEGGRHRRRRLGRRAHRRHAIPHRPAAAQGAEGDELVLHARLGDVVRLRDAGADRRLPGDVLRPVLDRGLQLDHPPDQRRLPRRVRSRPAQVGRDADDHPDLPPHGQDVLLRRLQVPARAQLGDRRRAADPHPGHGPDRLPAAVRPALLLGDDRGDEHHRLGPGRSARTWPTSCAPAPSSGRRRCRASTPSTCCWCRGRSSP